MVVEAITDDRNDVPKSIRHYAWQLKEDTRLPLTIGKKYVVGGEQQDNGFNYYLIIADEDEYTGRPWWYPSKLFQIVNPERPADWVDGDGVTSFPELAQDKTGTFYNNLQDGEPEELAIFLKHYEQYARAHNLWYVDGRPNRPKDQWEKPASLPGQEVMRKYQEDLRLAKERGYEPPVRPEG